MQLLVRISLFLWSLFAFAQQGDYYLKHIQPQLPNIDNDNYALAHDHLNRLYIGNRQGLIQYDGKLWNLIPTSGTVFSLLYDTTSNTMYVGCMNSAGVITTDEKGKSSYLAISDSKNPLKNVTKILSTDQFIYFVSENSLLEYSKKDKRITNVWKEALSAAFLLNKEIHIQKADGSIWKWNKGSLINAAIKNLNETVLFTQHLDGTDIIGTDKSNLFYFTNNQLNKIQLQDSSHLRQGQLADGIMLGKNSLLLSTVKGGCLLVNSTTGKTMALFHLFSGLPDNEVYAIGKDLSGGAWIAHEYGLSRLDAYLPYRCFSNYFGIAGHINNVQSFKNKLYVGTNEGIFLLAPHMYSTSAIASNKLPNKSPAKGLKNTNNEAIAEKTRQQRKRSIFKIFSKREKSEPKVQETPKEKTTVEKFKSVFKSQPTFVPAINNSLVAKIASYEYKKLESPELKCEQFIIYDDQLWAGTNRGIFIVNDTKAIPICEENIRYIFGSKLNKTLYASTTDGNVLAFSKSEAGTWKKLALFDFVKQPISSINEDEEGNLWLAGVDKLYKVKILQNSVEDIEEFEVGNPFSDNIMLVHLNGKLYVYLSGQFLFYDSVKHRLTPDPDMDNQYSVHDQLIYKQTDIIWLSDKNRWKAIGESLSNKPNLNFLSLFPAIRALYYDETQGLVWIVTKEDEIYNLDIKREVKLSHKPVVLLTSIRDEGELPIDISKIKLNYDNNNLNFYFSSPDYYNQEHLEYSYKIDGLSDTWSAGSNDNSVVLRFLNPGKYKLSAKVKNIFGQEVSLEPIEFKIIPPYWQTWWFYLVEVVVFTGLWFLTVQLSRKQLGNQMFIKLLTLLTLVMTVEFMSTVAENMINIRISPVIDFLVKVLIAITLLPIEKLLARVIRNKE